MTDNQIIELSQLLYTEIENIKNYVLTHQEEFEQWEQEQEEHPP